jgi:integrase
MHGLPPTWPAAENHILQFIASMSIAGKAYSTARTYLAGIAAKHKLNGWRDPTESFLVQKVMQGFAKGNSARDTRLPITLPRLQQLIPITEAICSNMYECQLFRAAFTLAFFGFFRVSELVGQGLSNKGGRKGLQVSDVWINSDMVINLSGSKTDQLEKGTQIHIQRIANMPEVCPVRAMTDYLGARGKGEDETLFIHIGGLPLTRYQFQAVLKKAARVLGWDLSRFSSHSFRIGAATTAAANGVSNSTIMAKGRWSSNAVTKYVRLDFT